LGYRGEKKKAILTHLSKPRQGASDPAIKALGALLADYLESRCVPLYNSAIALGQIPPAVIEEIDGLVDGAAAMNMSDKVTHKVLQIPTFL
jgi:hypothetical protein